MKKALILVSDINERHELITNYINKNSKKKIEVVLKNFNEISFRIETGNVECWAGDINLKDFNLVYFRQIGGKYLQLAGTISAFLKKNKIKFMDQSFYDIGASGDKLGNIVKLALNNIPIVPSYYLSIENIDKEKKRIIKEFGLPLFAKDLTRQKRKGLFVINTEKDFENLLIQNKKVSKGYLLQKYIQVEKEYRLVVMGNKMVAVHLEADRKIDKNTVSVSDLESAEGWLNSSTISRKMRQLVIKGTQILELNISGADFCIEKGTGNIYLFEINRGPGLTLDPNVSPELPELVKYFDKLI